MHDRFHGQQQIEDGPDREGIDVFRDALIRVVDVRIESQLVESVLAKIGVQEIVGQPVTPEIDEFVADVVIEDIKRSSGDDDADRFVDRPPIAVRILGGEP